MGGKHKGQAQRTKNNTKASTSGRSAELLSSNVAILPSFTDIIQEDFTSIIASKTGSDDFDASLSTEYQLAIKKMGKKDPTTKLKALQEFTALVEKSEVSEVTPVLPVWSKVYPTLSLDTEHRVREAAQISHGAVVRKCGRTLAPHLKQLAPPWLMSQYDTFAPAAAQAQSSLKNVFPAAKLPDVISFCRNELIAMISKNLLVHTPSTLVSGKSCTQEESEAVYCRLVIASLQGYALMIKHLPADHTEWFCHEQEAILNNNRFWKLAVNKNAQIRSAWYVAMGCLCEKQGTWFGEKYASKTLQTLIKNLNEEDSTVAPNIWDCLLMLMANKEGWKTDTKIDITISEKLSNVISNAGHGVATKLAPILLPLIAHLPETLKTHEFYTQFFDDMLKGMGHRSITSSKSEGLAWISGLSECLRFISVEKEINFANQLVPSVVRQWLQKAIHLRKAQNAHYLFKHSVVHLASLARFWTKQSSQIIRLFWQNLRFVFTTEMEGLDLTNDAIKAASDVHIELISGLNAAPDDKKLPKVKFADSTNSSEDSRTALINTSMKSDVYDRDLLGFVSEIAVTYLKLANQKNIAAPFLEPLYSIIAENDKVEIFNAMFHAAFPERTTVQLVSLYTDLWHGWMTGDSMRCQSVIELIFLLLKYLNETEQRVVFDGFNQFVPSVAEMCISKCLCHPYSSIPLVKQWLNSTVVTESLVATCKQLIKEGDRKKATLLKMCFMEDNNGVVLIGDKASAAIMNTISEHLPTINSIHLDMCASFASQISSVSIQDEQTRVNLILSMIKLNCTVKAGSDDLSTDTWWEVNIAWLDAIQSSNWTDEHILKLLLGAERIMKESLQSLNLDAMEVVTGLAANLICSLVSIKSEEERSQSLLSYFEKITGIHCALKEKQWCDIYYQSVAFDVIRAHLNVPFSSDDTTVESVLKNSGNLFNEDLDCESLEDFLTCSLFATKLLHRILLPIPMQQPFDEECNESSTMTCTLDLDLFAVLQDYILELLRCAMTLDSLKSTHQSWQHYSIISRSYSIIESLHVEIIKSIMENENRRQIIERHLEEKSNLEGLYWSKALCFFCKIFTLPSSLVREKVDEGLPLPESQMKILESVAPKSFNSFRGIGFFHRLQASVNIDKDNMDSFSIMSVAGIVALRCLALTDNILLTEEDITISTTGPFGCLSIIVDQYYKDKSIMLYERDISTATWSAIQLNVSVLRYLECVVKYYGWELNNMHWDFVTISLTLIMKSLRISKAKWRSLKWSALACAAFNLYDVVRSFIVSIPSRCIKSAPSEHVGELPNEWKDIFESDLHGDILIIVLNIFDNYLKNGDLKLTARDAYVIAEIGNSIRDKSLRSKEIECDTIMQSCASVLSSTRHHSLKYTAYNILKSMITELIESDNNILNALSEGCEEGTPLPKLALHKVEPALIHLQELLEVTLSPFKIHDDSCIFEPFTDSYSIALGYLFLWDFINKLCTAALGLTDLTHQYAQVLKNGKYIDHFSTNTFKMMPAEIIQRKESAQVESQLQAKFESILSTDYNEHISPSIISTASCSVLFGLMSGIGASAVRDWCILQDNERVIDRVISAYISPRLNYYSLQTVQQRAPELKDVEIRIHWSTNEVIAVHTVEEKEFELIIKLAPNNPLVKPKVLCSGVATNHTNWITMFLSYQHGSPWEAVRMWVDSLHKKIEGSAVCYICYCRLQPLTGQLTKFTCYTCKNKYHTTCLYKWFRQSSKNTCPLCRKQF